MCLMSVIWLHCQLTTSNSDKLLIVLILYVMRWLPPDILAQVHGIQHATTVFIPWPIHVGVMVST
jgi:hypothetical protein